MSILEKTLRVIVIGGVFLLPFICLIVADGVHFPYNLYFPYITGKNFSFRIIVEIIAGAWLALALIEPKYRPRRDWILGVFALFVIIMAVADAQGANPFKSFWSNFERMDGWVTLVHTFVYMVVAACVLNTEKLWRWAFWITLGVSVFASLYGFLQIAGALALGEGGAAGLGARIDATFGNPIYLAVYMLFHVFLATLLWAQAWKQGGKGKRLVPSLIYGAIIVIDTAALLFTGTRGTMLGLIGGAGLTVLILAFSPGASKRFRTWTAGGIALLVVFGGLLLLARDTPIVQNVIFLNRLSTINFTDDTVVSRLINIDIAWQGVKERPILGWGQENYAIVFDKYYDPRMYGQEQWFDRVHDIIFDWWIAGGTLGLLAYLSIFGAAFWTLWRKNGFDRIERAILTGLLVGYFIHLLTVFDSITSDILFATVLAYIMWRSSDAHKTKPLFETRILPALSLPFVTVACAILVWGAAWWVNANALAQNQTLLDAFTSQQAGLQQNLSLFQQAISYGTFGTQEVREQLVQGTTQLSQASGVPTAVKQQFFDYTTQQLQLQEAASPLDARFPLFLGVMQNAYGDYSDAATSFEKAHELSPDKQTILFEIGGNQQAQGDMQGALQTFKTAYELDTNDSQARILYAATAILLGQNTLADQLLAPIIANGQAADPHIAAAYVAGKQYGKIATIWAAHVKADPTDVQAYFTLAAAYYGEGDKQDAIAALRQAEAVSPSAATQADPLIQQIQNGTATL